MQIETTRDFKRPREQVLAQFRKPERIESVLTGMSASVTRTAEPPQPAWDCSIHWRDAPRRFALHLTETARDETIVLSITSDLADAPMTLDFYDLPDGGCRVIAKTAITAHTMIVKLALQSLRLVRGKAEERLGRMVNAIGRP